MLAELQPGPAALFRKVVLQMNAYASRARKVGLMPEASSGINTNKEDSNYHLLAAGSKILYVGALASKDGGGGNANITYILGNQGHGATIAETEPKTSSPGHFGSSGGLRV